MIIITTTNDGWSFALFFSKFMRKFPDKSARESCV